MSWGVRGQAALSMVARCAKRLVRSEVGQAVAVVSAAALVIVWQPIVSGGYLAPGDISQATPVLRSSTPDYVIENPGLTDQAVEYLPWLAWDRSELLDGRLPTWNPLNGSGVPHLANGQSAVFSVFTLPFYALSLRAALVVSAFAELLVAGMLAYGLARHLRLSHVGALVTGVGFAMSAFMVMQLRWPMATSGAFVPGMVWAADALASGRDRRARAAAAAGLAVCVGLSLLAGHPETTFFGVALAAAVPLARLVGRRSAVAAIGRRGVLVVGGVVLGASVAAVQVLPLLEYIGNSAAGENRGDHHQTFFDGQYAGLHAFPFVLGGSAHERVADQYVGLGILFLAGVGVASTRWTHRRLPLVLAAIAAGWVLYSHDVGGVGVLLGKLPVFDLVLVGRSSVVWTLCTTVLAGCAVDALRSPARPGHGRPTWPGHASRRSTGLLLWGVVLFAVAWLLQHRIHRSVGAAVDATVTDVAAGAARDHIVYVGTTFVVVVGAATLLAAAGPRRLLRAGGTALLIAGIFLQSGHLLRDYNPTIEPELFYADTPAFSQLTDITGRNQTLRLDDTALTPDINLWYGVSSPGSYDAIGVRGYDALYRHVLRAPRVEFYGAVLNILNLPVDPRGTGSLRTMGIRYVTTGRDYPFGRSAGDPRLVSVDADGTARFELETVGDVDVLTAHSAVIEQSTSCLLTVRDALSPLTAPALATAEATCGRGGAVFSLDDIDMPVGARLAIAVSPRRPQGTGTVADPGHARLSAFTTEVRRLDLVAEVDNGFRVFRVPGSPPRYFSPAATEAGSLDDGTPAIVDADADPMSLSAIDSSDAAPNSGGTQPGRVDVISETSTTIRLRVSRATPGWVVALQTRYPGWAATVDGRAVDLATANGAFIGVPVPAGESEVVLRFRPASVRMGAAVSLAASLGVIALALAAWRADRPVRRTRSRPPGPRDSTSPPDRVHETDAPPSTVTVPAAQAAVSPGAPAPT